MAIQIIDRLAKIICNTSADDRFTNWLWVTLKETTPTQHLGKFKSQEMRERMAEILSTDSLLINEVKRRAIKTADKKQISWIKDSKRQRVWVETKLHISQLITNELRASLSNQELSVLIIDYVDSHQSQPQTLASTLRQEWEQQEKEDRVFDWFQKEAEEDKCGFAWDFLGKKYYEISLMEEKFRSLDDLLAYVYTHKPSKELIELLISNAKSRWSQKKYRSKQESKKQYNFILSDSAINRLDKLVEKHDLKRPQIIEILLQMETEEGAYLPKKIKVLMNS